MKIISYFLSACFVVVFGSMGLSQQHLTAPKLFPTKTLAYVRVDDTRDMKSKMESTGMGKMMNDPQIAPILGTFYSTFVGQLQGMQDVIG
jgi:hypothetical protein